MTRKFMTRILVALFALSLISGIATLAMSVLFAYLFSVSYTHLDVYKRQIQNNAVIAALKRCATQNREQDRVFQQPANKRRFGPRGARAIFNYQSPITNYKFTGAPYSFSLR